MEANLMRVLQSATRSLVGIVLLGLALAGCGGDSNAPDAPFSASGTNSDMEAMSSAFDNQIAESYAAASVQIGAVVGGPVSAAVAAAPKPSLFRDRAGAMRYATSVARTYLSSGSGLKPAFSSAAVPAEYLGVTFVYDVESNSYVSSDLSGAPSNGVRFLLYAVDPITGEIVEPLNQVGYADIVTTETSSSYSIQVRLVSGGVTYLDYTIALGGTTSSLTLSISGYATNGTDRVNFDLDHHVSGNDQSATMGLDYVLTVPTRGGFRIDIEGTMELTVVGDQFQTVTSIDLEARGEHGTVRIEGGGTNGTGTYEVFVNGELFANIAVNAGGVPVITGASGAPLTEEEQATVRAIFLVFIQGGDFFEDLRDPISF
jgi:hypothetical protein